MACSALLPVTFYGLCALLFILVSGLSYADEGRVKKVLLHNIHAQCGYMVVNLTLLKLEVYALYVKTRTKRTMSNFNERTIAL